MALQIIRRNGQSRIVVPDPAFGVDEAGHGHALGDMFLVVPVMKLIGMGGREVERREQQALGHGGVPPGFVVGAILPRGWVRTKVVGSSGGVR
jgi:hypothetical protein